jgi:2-polyprenyl-3-methyl-5-hydroxy-6-metoxy-1,4-benzoquinol methylase
LNACPVCGAKARTLAFTAMRDIVFGVAPGSWQLYRCGDCGCFYMDPRPTRESILLVYDEYFTHATDQHTSLASPATLLHKLRNDYLAWRLGYDLPSNGPFGRWLLWLLPFRRRRFERLVRDLPAPGARSRLLDIGCGSGEFLARMREIGWTVVGQEVDPKAAAAARKRGIDVVLGTLDEKAFDGKFDAITMNHVIEHVHDPVEVLSACHKLLAPGGRLWMATPHADALGRRRFGPHWVELDSPRHLIVFSRRSLELALRRAGFTHAVVRPDIGLYGSTAGSAALHQQQTGGGKPGTLRVHAENLIGDTVMSLVPALGNELVATAER